MRQRRWSNQERDLFENMASENISRLPSRLQGFPERSLAGCLLLHVRTCFSYVASHAFGRLRRRHRVLPPSRVARPLEAFA